MEEAAREAENTRAEEAAKAKSWRPMKLLKASNSMAAKAKTSQHCTLQAELAVAKAKAAIKRDKKVMLHLSTLLTQPNRVIQVYLPWVPPHQPQHLNTLLRSTLHLRVQCR